MLAMANRTEAGIAGRHPLVEGAVSFWNAGVRVAAKVSDITVIPIFWHLMASDRKAGGVTDEKAVYAFILVLRGIVPFIMTMDGLTGADQRLFAVGSAFLVGSVVDGVLTSLYMRGIGSLKNK